MSHAEDLISQAERRRIIANDRRVRAAATFHSMAQSSLDDERGGRYATEGSKATVVGASPVGYPAQPANSPWASNPYPDEPLIDGRGEGTTLGYEIDRPDVVSNASPASSTSLRDAGVGTPPPSSTELSAQVHAGGDARRASKQVVSDD
jgi:hypothetical protein